MTCNCARKRFRRPVLKFGGAIDLELLVGGIPLSNASVEIVQGKTCQLVKVTLPLYEVEMLSRDEANARLAAAD